MTKKSTRRHASTDRWARRRRARALGLDWREMSRAQMPRLGTHVVKVPLR